MSLDRFQPPESGDNNRFRDYGDGDPDVDANDSGERCETCCELLEECKCPKQSEDEP